MPKYAVLSILALSVAATPLAAQFPPMPLGAPGTAGIAQPITTTTTPGVTDNRSTTGTPGSPTPGGSVGIPGSTDRTVIRQDQIYPTKPGATGTSAIGATATGAAAAGTATGATASGATTAAGTSSTVSSRTAESVRHLDPGPEATGPGLYATLVTTMGSIKFKLFETEAPQTVRNFVDLSMGRKQWRHPDTQQSSRRPLIPGTTFHRVIPGFLIQGGDPTGTGRGDVGFVTPDEFRRDLMFDRPGRVAMAHAGPGTAASQFFITDGDASWLNGKYTIFGQVVEGQDVVRAISNAPRGAEDKPTTAVKIVKVAFLREGSAPPNAPEGPPSKKTASPAKTAATPAAAAATPVAKKAVAAPKK